MAKPNITFTVKTTKTIWYYILLLIVKIRAEKLAYKIVETKELFKLKLLS